MPDKSDDERQIINFKSQNSKLMDSVSTEEKSSTFQIEKDGDSTSGRQNAGELIMSPGNQLEKEQNNGAIENKTSKRLFTYYAVYIQNLNENKENRQLPLVYSNYDDAVKYCRKNKDARFRGFQTKEEAENFSLECSKSGSANPIILEGIAFKKLTPQEICVFRKSVESGDYNTVKRLIWSNPRYIMSDSTTLIKPAYRYNSLHVCAFSNNAKIADLILQTISDPTFIEFCGDKLDSSYINRSEIIIDVLLNTPEQMLNETPLHFASKFGAVDVVRTFVAYPQCRKDLENKYGQKAKDIICSRAKGSANSQNIKQEIKKLLEDCFFVPLWSSEDNVVPPIIGEPFSPPYPPASPVQVKSPIAPEMTIKAFAGPIPNREDAFKFHREWKKPARSIFSPSRNVTKRAVPCTSPSSHACTSRSVGTTPQSISKNIPERSNTNFTPHPETGILIRERMNFEKEHSGRKLAEKHGLSFSEYWPFLNRFIDLRSKDGLDALEEFFKLRHTELHKKFEEKISIDWPVRFILSDSMIDRLIEQSQCCTLNSPKKLSSNSNDLLVNKNEDCLISSQKELIIIENLCRELSNEMADYVGCLELIDIGVEQNIRLLQNIDEFIKRMNAQVDEKLQKNFIPKVHNRIAHLIAQDIFSKYGASYFKISSKISELILSTDTVIFESGNDSNDSRLQNFICDLKCIGYKINHFLSNNYKDADIATSNEIQLHELWSSIGSCSCVYKICAPSSKPAFNRRIDFGNGKENEDSDDDDDEDFFTPPCSPAESISSIDDALEGPKLFIEGDEGTKLDLMVFDALAEVKFDRTKYPNIYRWKHFMSSDIDKHTTWKTPKKQQPIISYWSTPTKF